MSEPELILHVGAPKCGSSALQTALTRHPDLQSGAGQRLRYVALRGGAENYRPVQGRVLRQLVRTSVYGYACWPNFGPKTDAAPILSALGEVLRMGQRRGWVPILSCEGWINHPQILAEALAHLGHPRVDVVAFLRPPAEWVNAAWWQWGVWTGHGFDTWLERGFLPYGFADHLADWSRIPGLRLRVRRSRPDVVGKFVSLYACDLDPQMPANAAPPPSLIGFLLRNRQYRPTPHDAQSEFIFQRWCVMRAGQGLWVLEPRHIRALRPLTRQNREMLQRILSPEDRADVLADLRWTREEPYHDAIRAGISLLHDPADLPALHEALVGGIAAASAAAGRKMPDLPAPPAAESTGQWDPVLCALFDRLIALDAELRRLPALEAALRAGNGLLRGAGWKWR